MSFQDFVFAINQEFLDAIKEHKQYWNLKRRVLRRLKDNKNHRK